MLFLQDALFNCDVFWSSDNLPELLFRFLFQMVLMLLVDWLLVVEPISILAKLDLDYRVIVFVLVRRCRHPGILNPRLREADLIVQPLNQVRALQRGTETPQFCRVEVEETVRLSDPGVRGHKQGRFVCLVMPVGDDCVCRGGCTH